MVYSLSTCDDNDQNDQKCKVQLTNYCKNFSKKPIQQIEVLAGMLLAADVVSACF